MVNRNAMRVPIQFVEEIGTRKLLEADLALSARETANEPYLILMKKEFWKGRLLDLKSVEVVGAG